MFKAIGSWFLDIVKLVLVKLITFVIIILSVYFAIKYFLKVDMI